MKKIFPYLIGLLIIAGACGATSFGQARKPLAKPATSALLYKISGKGLAQPSYLYGTIHIVCPAQMFPKTKFLSFLNTTQRLLLEIDMDDPVIMQKMATALVMPDGKTLDSLLTPTQYAKVSDALKSSTGIPLDMVKTISPIGLSVMITTSPKALGCARPGAYETALMKMAAKNKKPVEGLETVEDQIDALARMPLEKQAQHLYKMSLDPQKSIDQYKQMLKIYNSQDTLRLAEFFSSGGAETANFQSTLLTERNKKWLPKIEKAIREKPTFIAVGAGHLEGENGVVKLLRAQGYILTPIRF